MPINRGMGRQNVVHTAMEYYSAVQKEGNLAVCGTWGNFKVIVLSGRRQSQKDKHPVIPLR